MHELQLAEDVPDAAGGRNKTVEGAPEQYLTIDGERTKLSAGQYVKLNQGVIVKLGPDPKANEPMLVLDKKAIPDFDKLADQSVVNTTFDEKLLAEEGRIVSVSKATMTDFMRYYDVTLMNPKVLVGMLIGSMSVFVFCALTMKAVGSSVKSPVLWRAAISPTTRRRWPSAPRRHSARWCCRRYWR